MQKVTLRYLTEADLPPLLQLKEESWFGTHRITFTNEEMQLKWFKSLLNSPHTPSNIVLLASEEYDFGIFKILNIDWQNRKAEVGWDVFAHMRNNGLGKLLVKAGVDFCRDVLQFNTLRAEILVSNLASQKCAEFAGFYKIGVEKSAIFKNRTYIDNLIYGLLL
jgi:RimJ/RimL family protein N-acetyltransferase